ncbi:MAG: cell division protein FtsA, partial [bacterium]
VVLTGGGAKFTGVVSIAEEIFGCPARIGTPMGFAEHNDEWKDPSFAASVGLIRALTLPTVLSSPKDVQKTPKIWGQLKRMISGKSVK